jgi:MFS family permease
MRTNLFYGVYKLIANLYDVVFHVFRPLEENQMKRMLLGIARLWQGICIGVCVSVVFGLAYIVILHEPGSAFYLFAGLAFFGGSLIGGIVAALKTQAHKRKAFFTSVAP